MKGSKGYRRRTRNLRKRVRESGKVRIGKYLKKFKEDDTVSISIDSSYQSIPHPRFQGKTGRVVGAQGRSYYVQIKDGKKLKKVLVTPEHLTLQG